MVFGGRRAGRLEAVGAVIALGALALAAPTWAASRASIRDFRVIEVGKTQLQVAADGKSAVVRVRTDPPTVCAIAYGRTASLGSIANDPSMGGTAISRHVVVLRGLTPNTTYRFRLTATDAQGRVFQTTQIGMFKTTPSATAAGSRDIAAGAKVVAVSSQWSTDYRGANAVDGQLGTEWASAGDGDRAFITIDLGKKRKIGGVSFLTREMGDGTAITRTFDVVVDGGKRYGPFAAGNPTHPRIAAVSFTGRRLRFDVVKSTGGNTGAVEIEVFAAGAGLAARR
jgi:hypothetical protein